MGDFVLEFLLLVGVFDGEWPRFPSLSTLAPALVFQSRVLWFRTLRRARRYAQGHLQFAVGIFILLVRHFGNFISFLQLAFHRFERFFGRERSSFSGFPAVFVLLSRRFDGFALFDVFLETFLNTGAFFLQQRQSTLESTGLQFGVDSLFVGMFELLGGVLCGRSGDVKFVLDLGDFTLNIRDFLLKLGSGFFIFGGFGFQSDGLFGGGVLLLHHGVHFVLDRLHLGCSFCFTSREYLFWKCASHLLNQLALK